MTRTNFNRHLTKLQIARGMSVLPDNAGVHKLACAVFLNEASFVTPESKFGVVQDVLILHNGEFLPQGEDTLRHAEYMGERRHSCLLMFFPA